MNLPQLRDGGVSPDVLKACERIASKNAVQVVEGLTELIDLTKFTRSMEHDHTALVAAGMTKRLVQIIKGAAAAGITAEPADVQVSLPMERVEEQFEAVQVPAIEGAQVAAVRLVSTLCLDPATSQAFSGSLVDEDCTLALASLLPGAAKRQAGVSQRLEYSALRAVRLLSFEPGCKNGRLSHKAMHEAHETGLKWVCGSWGTG